LTDGFGFNKIFNRINKIRHGFYSVMFEKKLFIRGAFVVC